MGGQLKHPCTAHPIIDRKTKEFFAFSYDITSPIATLSVFNRRKKLTRQLNVENTCSRMNHDWLITENFLIFPDLPMECDPREAVKNN